MKVKYKYIVYVGGCDDFYTTYERAKKHYDEWIEEGYDDVHLVEISDENYSSNKDRNRKN